ncbi:hypothetical protein [Actibacterium sp. 188UL27-1]|uniref:hypothetical protein n=1 Tax=Actibacterium sp. 188UL27-1 TaxID=2786961 RepID=UPI00195A2EEA|nr:hypothetical protein [Actibacterium sp. 188UL27-1]MBM7070249.1 hypothetical protein [Actibacterium sp. 188UL27-1]
MAAFVAPFFKAVGYKLKRMPRATRSALFTIALLSFASAPAWAGEPGETAQCSALIRLLPADLWDLPVATCDAPEHGQVTVAARLRVPAKRVLEVQDRLVADHAMAPCSSFVVDMKHGP